MLALEKGAEVLLSEPVCPAARSLASSERAGCVTAVAAADGGPELESAATGNEEVGVEVVTTLPTKVLRFFDEVLQDERLETAGVSVDTELELAWSGASDEWESGRACGEIAEVCECVSGEITLVLTLALPSAVALLLAVDLELALTHAPDLEVMSSASPRALVLPIMKGGRT